MITYSVTGFRFPLIYSAMYIVSLYIVIAMVF